MYIESFAHVYYCKVYDVYILGCNFSYYFANVTYCELIWKNETTTTFYSF